MHLILRILVGLSLWITLLASCAFPPAAAPPQPSLGTITESHAGTAPLTAVPPATPIVVSPIAQPSQTPSPATPTLPATPAPVDTQLVPTPTVYLPTVATTSTPTIPTVLDVPLQAAALLPEFAQDLAGANGWDRYSITATLNPTDLTISGSQQVAVTNQAGVPFDALYFHLYPNHPDFGGSLEVRDVRVNDQPVTVSTEQDGVLLRVELVQPLNPGEQAIVALNFLARSQRNAAGSVYGAFNQESGVWALASFYPVLARYFADGWDRRPVSSRGDLAVTETALYDVTLDTPADWALVTTGVRVDAGAQSAAPPPEGYRRERFVSGPQRDFFLAALNGLDQASSEVDGTRIITYYQAGNPAAGQRSLIVAEESLRAFNARYGRYPLAELEVVQAALTRFLGVEYPGVVLIEQNLYRNNGRGLETTVAHEVAHQWWYSLVGNDYQGEPWLDEGLESYSQVVYYEALGNAAGAAGELQLFRDIYLGARNTGNDGVVNRPTAAFRGNYVALVYAKSALFFQALRERVGDEVFYQILQRYYETYRHHEATGEDLLAVAQARCGCDLRQFYDDWINSTAPVEVP